MNKFLLVLSVSVLISCTTTKDLSVSASAVENAYIEIQESNTTQVVYEEKIVYVKQPIIIPQTVSENKVFSDTNTDDVLKSSVEASAVKPEEWNGGQFVYDYAEQFRYPVVTKALTITEIKLQPGEKVNGNLVIGDTTRWEIGSEIGFQNGIETQYILIKPHQTGLTTSLIIYTTKRRYYIELSSIDEYYMMSVKWNYPLEDNILPNNTISLNSNSSVASTFRSGMLNFNYKVEFSSMDQPPWVPVSVFDDGLKTFIVFPISILNQKIPGLWIGEDEVVNYRVDRNTFIVDQIAEKYTLRIGNVIVRIYKEPS